MKQNGNKENYFNRITDDLANVIRNNIIVTKMYLFKSVVNLHFIVHCNLEPTDIIKYVHLCNLAYEFSSSMVLIMIIGISKVTKNKWISRNYHQYSVFL